MRCAAALAAFALSSAALAAPADKYTDPDAASTGAAARAATANVRVLESARVLDIVGMTRGIDSVLKDLGARITEREIRIELAADVLFEFDKADLRPQAFASLEKVAEVLRSTPNAPVTIEGHTDAKGSDAYNQPLSERRAAAVREWLVRKGGAAAARITSRGWGKTKPLVPNTKPDGSDDPDGRQKNRRVEITLRTR